MMETRFKTYLYSFIIFIIPSAYLFTIANDFELMEIACTLYFIGIIYVTMYEYKDNEEFQKFLTKWF